MLPDAIPLTARLQAAFRRRAERLPEDTQAALLLAAAESAGEPAIVIGAMGDSGPAARCARPGRACGAYRDRCRVAQLPASARTLRRPPFGHVRRTSTRSRCVGRSAWAPEHADLRVWHRSEATLTANEDIAAELEASAERSEMRGGHASAATAFERAARLSDTDQARGIPVPRQGPPPRPDSWLAPTISSAARSHLPVARNALVCSPSARSSRASPVPSRRPSPRCWMGSPPAGTHR